MSDLPHGATAIVTGAGRGFGLGIAAALASSGAHVVGVGRDAAALDAARDGLGPSFTAVVGDVTDDSLAGRLIAEHRPQVVMLNAGAAPRAASIRDQTWESFSLNWQVDVRQTLSFVRAALSAPLAGGSTVISMSSGAALMGSPMSGGYAGAKATIRFISDYAGAESERLGLDVRFIALLPKLTHATELGSTFVDTYADYEQVDRLELRERVGPMLTVEQVGDAVLELLRDPAREPGGYALTAGGLGDRVGW
ncbi:SDR family oxidoreductase [Dermatobacter hominis]|uniref:SDR family oxidoreductase n=1 Tax=Dermatobacter hominis TaxID=2884263 RepID=UPI001D10BF5E|nr:SDR family oxidoreductase [Dermatobacter hominis]UDY34921.1 SDR family oxidoreductase [Dermatobacter hominis]